MPALHSGLPTLAQAIEGKLLRYAIKEDPNVRVKMIVMLAETCDMLTATFPTNKDWPQQFVDDFTAKYDTETLEDWALFLTMVRRGDLKGPEGEPQFHGWGGRCDGSVLGELFSRYLAHKADAREGMEDMRKKNAWANFTHDYTASPAMLKLAQDMKSLYTTRQQRERREGTIKELKRIVEGLDVAEKATTRAELRLCWMHYPYQRVHEACKTKAETLPDDRERS